MAEKNPKRPRKESPSGAADDLIIAELDASAGGIQALTVELTAVNQQLKNKVEELTRANNNFTDLMNSAGIGIIFLDRSLRVRLFTPRAVDVFNLNPSDIGRQLLDITNRLRYEDLIDDARQVMQTVRSRQRELLSDDNRWYLVRILPYRTIENRGDGVVLTFTDVSENKQSSRDLNQARRQLKTKDAERSRDLAAANQLLSSQVDQHRRSEVARLTLLGQLVTVQENERRRLALDIHDQLGQQVTALRLKLESLKAQSGKRKALHKDINDLLDITTQLDIDVDFLAWELRPLALDDLGLGDALQNYASLWSQRVNIPIGFHSLGLADERAPVEVENNLYRIAQEALNNVAKHAEATRVDILLERRNLHLALIIEDNGLGFKVPEADGAATMGIANMRERTALIEGEFQIESKSGKGTTIFVRVPWPRAEN